MISDSFGAILQELAQSMKIGELHSDSNSACRLKLKEGGEIQLELDRSGYFLVIGADLGEVPPGKYRENIFREALKANDLPPPIHGVLAYSRAANHMILFEKIHTKDLNGEKVAAALTPFIAKARTWTEALQRGEIPVLTEMYSTGRQSSGMFGLRP